MQVFLKMRRLFFPFSALQVILVSDLHRLTEGSAQTPESLCLGRRLLQVLGLLHFVLLPNATLTTFGQVPPSPAALRNVERVRRGKTRRK